MSTNNWKTYGFEFLSIFIAVLSAFALTSWNDNRKDEEAATKILAEIHNGLLKDIDDIQHNRQGHKQGIDACNFWRKIILEEDVDIDSIMSYYSHLTRDFISIQNISGYESLKSKGLELIADDSLRFQIINMYEYDYNVLKKLEEEYYEMQYQKNYFKEFNTLIAPQFIIDDKGNITGIQQPLQLSQKDKNLLLTYLWKIQVNRDFIIKYYDKTQQKLIELQGQIDYYLEK